MYTVVVAIKVRPEHLEEFEDAVTRNAVASIEDEPGCLGFDVHRSTIDPSSYLLHEVYVDEDAFFVAHRSSPHYRDWQLAAEKLLEPGERVNSYYEPLVLHRDLRDADAGQDREILG